MIKLRFLFLISALSLFELVNAQTEKITLLSWNIYMRPRIMFWNQQITRSEAIVNVIKSDSIDVVVFQEAFDRKARKIIRKGLKNIYPFELGPGKKGVISLNSGVWILSKYAITNTLISKYNDCGREDCMARKSVVFAEIEKNGKKIHLFGTHLQAINGEKYNKIRRLQFSSMNEIADKFSDPKIPQIFIGDMNTATADSIEYNQMLKTLNTSDSAPTSKLQYSSCGNENDITKKEEKEGKDLIDFILLKKNNTNTNFQSKEVMRYQSPMKTGRKDLSDHYAIKAIIVL